MHIVCCIKQVPDTAHVKIDPNTNTLIRSGVESICNPYDLVATETAMQLIERYGGKVTVISMGPPQAESALRECLALGADKAILLSDRAFAGGDTLATSYCLAQAILKVTSRDPVTLVICGKQAIDGDTGQTGPGLGTQLEYNQFTYVSQIPTVDLEQNTITVKRRIEGGSEIIQGQLPALITVELGLARPRHASLPDLVRALRQDIEVWGLQQIGAEEERVGLKGSPTWVKEIFPQPPRKGGIIFDWGENNTKAVDDFLDTLFEKQQHLPDERSGKLEASDAQE